MMRKLGNFVKKSSKYLIAGSVATVAISAISFYEPQVHDSYLRYTVGNSVVKVMTSERGGGTGFAVKAASGKEFIATNNHVCSSSENGWVKLKGDNGLEVWKRIIYKDTRHDLCLIEGDSRLSPLKLGSSQYLGEHHYIVGHPGLRPITLSKGEHVGFENVKLLDEVKTKKECKGELIELSPIEQFLYGREFVCIKTFKSIQSSAVAYPGNSGSPVVNKYGNVIGVLFAGSRDSEHVSYIVPLYELTRVLNKF